MAAQGFSWQLNGLELARYRGWGHAYVHGRRKSPYNTKYTSPLRVFDNFNSKAETLVTVDVCKNGKFKSQVAPSCHRPQPSQNFPKSKQNLSNSHPKSTQNRSRRPFGAHLEPMLEKSLIWKVHKTAKSRPRVPRRGPRLSQTLPK